MACCETPRSSGKKFAGWKNYSETVYSLMHENQAPEASSAHYIRPTSAPPSGYNIHL